VEEARLKRVQRRGHFKTVLNELLERAEVSDTELARRLGVNRLTVRRWRQGESLPNEVSVRSLRAALRWADGDGVVRELSEDELDRLIVAAGYHTAPTQPEFDRVTPTDQCTVYTHRYSPDVFPARWSERIIEVERSSSGSIYTMWGQLPSITRPPEFYASGYENGMYERHLVEAYMDAHAARQADLLTRLQTAEVHHLYSIQGICTLLSGAWTPSNALWDWKLPAQLLKRQIDTIVEWLDEYPNFEVRLRPNVPGNVIIIGLHTVLVEFTHSSRTTTTDNVTGLEIVGPDATLQFTKQFRSFWADEETIKDRDHVVRELEMIKSDYLGDRSAA
jgi:hypothetical protein